jgi:hypothetical protein
MIPGSSTQLLEKLFYSLNSCHFLSHAYLHKYHQLVRTQQLHACFNVKEIVRAEAPQHSSCSQEV